MTLWLTLLGMAVVTFALRAAFLVLPPGTQTPALLKRALHYVPAAGAHRDLGARSAGAK